MCSSIWKLHKDTRLSQPVTMTYIASRVCSHPCDGFIGARNRLSRSLFGVLQCTNERRYRDFLYRFWYLWTSKQTRFQMKTFCSVALCSKPRNFESCFVWAPTKPLDRPVRWPWSGERKGMHAAWAEACLDNGKHLRGCQSPRTPASEGRSRSGWRGRLYPPELVNIRHLSARNEKPIFSSYPRTR